MKILLQGSTWENIGNGFIDQGAKAIIESSIDDVSIVEASGYNASLLENYSGPILRRVVRAMGYPNLGEKLQGRYQRSLFDTHLVSISSLADIDLAVLPGCVLDDGLSVYKHILFELSSRNVPIVFLGAGGAGYTQSDQQYVRSILSSLEETALISRDRTTYELYKNHVDYAFDGIDCGFFTSDWYEPPTTDRAFNVATFDKIPEPPEVPTDSTTIRPAHVPISNASPAITAIKSLLPSKFVRRQGGYIGTKNGFVSEKLQDYAFLYKNSQQVFSDRIHACVPSLSYGNECRFYYETSRSGLFEKFNSLDTIDSELTRIDPNELERKKGEQIEFFTEASEQLVK